MSSIREALILQRRELERRLGQRYIKREARIHGISSDMIKVIIGPRRSGKSFFAMNQIGNAGSFGYANFDDETLVDAKDYNEIIAELDSVYNKPKHILFDEVQNLKRWELFVNRLQRQGYNLIITGSNSNLLSKELSTHLTGRHMIMDMMPLSFREFVSSEGKELTTQEIKTRFFEYSEHGGYPEPLVKGLDYREYLSTLFESIIYKDIVKRYRIRKPQIIEELASYLISNTAKEFSYNNLTEMTSNESPHTTKTYINYLKEAFIFFEVGMYSRKMKEQIRHNKKIYCIDNGFILAKAFKTSQEKGRLYKNLVAIELKRKTANGHSGFYYWKNQQQEEVDFVITDSREISELIQVCANLEKQKTRSREIRALLKASKELGCDSLTILTEDYEAEEEEEWFGIKKVVKFTPIWKWLLKKIT